MKPSAHRRRKHQSPPIFYDPEARPDLFELIVELLPDPCEYHGPEQLGENEWCGLCGTLWPCAVERARELTGAR